MIVSLNELESAMRKAFRGSGYHWGEAEEAGTAVVWLARRSLSFMEPALELLRAANCGEKAFPPLIEGNTWRGHGGRLCPIRAGIALSDLAGAFPAGTEIRFDDMASPMLLLPFLAMAAEACPWQLELSFPGYTAKALDRQTAWHIANAAPHCAPGQLYVSRSSAALPEAVTRMQTTAEVSATDWQEINTFAALTYVPASEHSRIAGAGAGVADND